MDAFAEKTRISRGRYSIRRGGSKQIGDVLVDTALLLTFQ